MGIYTGVMEGAAGKDWERIMKRQEVVLKALQGELTWVQVAEILGLTSRQVRRIKARYERLGPQGLLDDRRGASRNKVSSQIIEKVCSLYREQYFDYNVKHFHEKLRSLHGITQSYPWLLYTLQSARLVARHAKRDPHRKKRERRPLPGMMIHLDGSDHAWAGWQGEDAPRWDLLATLDDATSEVYEATFVDEEDTRSVLGILKQTIEKNGVFCSLYTDRATHFVVTDKAGERPDTTNMRTQCQRALDHLGIRLIAANSPQARGRGERLWRTFQGRLPQELRTAGIREMKEANRYLKEVFIPEYNKNFRVSSKEEGSAFVPTFPGMNLERVFSIQHERVVSNDNTVSYRTRILQLPESSLRYSFARCKVTVYEHLDGRLELGFGPHCIGLYDAHGQLLKNPNEKPTRKAA